MKLSDRINIIVTENDGDPSEGPLVWESYASNSASTVGYQARKLAQSGKHGKVYIGSIPSNCLTEITPIGVVKNSAGVRFKDKPVAEEVEISDVAIERLVDDVLPFASKVTRYTDESGLFFDAIKKAKAHAIEVSQAEKVEKYKRDLLNSREARFYKRFRELGATHDEAVKYAWGDE